MVLNDGRGHNPAVINQLSGKNPSESNDNTPHRDYRETIIRMVEKSNLTILTRSSDHLPEKAIARCLFSVYAFADIAGYDIGAILDEIESGDATERTWEQFRQLEAAAFRSPISRWDKHKTRVKLTRH